MNANELADVLEGFYDGISSEYSGFEQMEEAAAMLRQQQAEIEALKKEVTRWQDAFHKGVRI